MEDPKAGHISQGWRIGDLKESEKSQTSLYVIRIGKVKLADFRLMHSFGDMLGLPMGYPNICQKTRD